MFKHYPKIDNSYREKTINMFLKHYPELVDEKYIIQHKYDGSNISLIFYPSGDIQICTRNRLLDPDEDFYNIREVLKKPEYEKLLDYGYSLAVKEDKKFHFYGEIFGQGIQKRIDYGPDKYFRVFDVCSMGFDNEDFSFWPQYKIHNDNILSDYLVEIFDIVDGIEEALKYKPSNFDEIEGVVIKPFHNIYLSPQGSIFYLKNKNPKFEERGNKVKKDNKLKFSEDVENLYREFSQYVNENRVLSVFSKIGEIQEPKEIGKYIKEVLKDAQEDFEKDGFDVSGYDKKEQKYILNVGSSIVHILQKYL